MERPSVVDIMLAALVPVGIEIRKQRGTVHPGGLVTITLTVEQCLAINHAIAEAEAVKNAPMLEKKKLLNGICIIAVSEEHWSTIEETLGTVVVTVSGRQAPTFEPSAENSPRPIGEGVVYGAL